MQSSLIGIKARLAVPDYPTKMTRYPEDRLGQAISLMMLAIVLAAIMVVWLEWPR